MGLPSPPSYQDVARSATRDVLPDQTLQSLVLDNSVIYADASPSSPLYQLSNPPTTASAPTYGIQKVRYRLVPDSPDASPYDDDDDVGTISTRLIHIYDFKNPVVETNVRGNVEVIGRRPNLTVSPTFQDVRLSPAVGGWPTGIAVQGHFRAERHAGGLRLRRPSADQLAWRDTTGRLVALETRAVRKADGCLADLPRLQLKAVLGEMELDLLVTCWAARVWKQSAKELKQPMTWDKCTCPTPIWRI